MRQGPLNHCLDTRLLMPGAQEYEDVKFTASDGLQLYARKYGSRDSRLTPVLCLAGLTRNSADFHFIASHMATDRLVLAPDYRGRGKSQYASDPASYQPETEMADAIALLKLYDIKSFVVIGTSRGGLIAMIMGAAMKDRLCGVVLNDIGPKLEDEGLLRIVDYLGLEPDFKDWDEAVAALKQSQTGFENLNERQWLAYAKRIYREENGRPVMAYDPALTTTFPDRQFIEAGKIPQLWDLYEQLAGLPVAVIRGENSDLLSPLTLDKMKKLHPGLITATVPARGHVPFLDEPEAIRAIDQLLVQADDLAGSTAGSD